MKPILQNQSYWNKSVTELLYICEDAKEAAEATKSIGNLEAEAKYLDQVNDACTVLYHLRKSQ